MKRNCVRSTIGDEPAAQPTDGFRVLAQGILQQVNREISRTDFLEELAKMLLDFSACDAVELRVGRGDQCLRCEAVRRVAQPVVLEVTRRRTPDQSVLLACQRRGNGIDAICRMLVEKRLPASSGCLTQAGSFWTGDLKRTLPVLLGREFDEIVATSLHAREIIKRLMLFARQTPPQKKPVGLNAVVEEALYFLESRCVKQGVSVERRLAAELPEIAADPSQLNQVLVNLAVNAIQAMPAGGTLTIATRRSGDCVVLSVEDTGVGMDAEVQSRIFTPFFTTKDVNEGTGLGLPVVHGIVTSHEGTIAVQSAPGRGARFEISLPVPHAEND